MRVGSVLFLSLEKKPVFLSSEGSMRLDEAKFACWLFAVLKFLFSNALFHLVSKQTFTKAVGHDHGHSSLKGGSSRVPAETRLQGDKQ